MGSGVIFVIIVLALFIANALVKSYIKQKVVNEIAAELKNGNTERLKELIFSNKAKRNLNKSALLSLQLSSLCADKKYEDARELLNKTDYSNWPTDNKLSVLKTKLDMAYQMEDFAEVSKTEKELNEIADSNINIKKAINNTLLDAEISYKLL